MEEGYDHGGDIYSQPVELDFSANINPLGLPAGVKEALNRCIAKGGCSVYPDSRCRGLRQALGAYYHVPESWILCGNGAADLIFGLAQALRPRRALLMAPSFSEYGKALLGAGCRTEYFYLKEEEGFVPDMDGFCRRIEEGAYELVFFCNPNNPTGISAGREEVLAAARACRRAGTFLAVDECFLEFLEDGREKSLIPCLAELTGVMVFGAFTKMYAMAGLRLGYALCRDEDLLGKMCGGRQPWPVSGPAQAAGEAALKEEAYRRESRRMIGRERQRLAEGIGRLGFRVYSSEANFLFFKDMGPGPDQWLCRALLEKGILIRGCGNYPGLDGSYYRVCVRCGEENQELLRKMEAAVQERRSGKWQNPS